MTLTVSSFIGRNLIMDEYTRVVKAGKGHYSTVYKAYRKNREAYYAIKLFNEFADDIEYEVGIMKHLNHPHVISLITNGICKKTKCIVTPYYETDLRKFLKSNVVLSIVEAQQILFGVLRGLQYLHSQDIVHRDIKPANILLDSSNNSVICDLGLSIYYDEEPLFDKVGTPNYIAPEILLGNGYDYRVDIWSFGVVLYVCLVGVAPFSTKKRADTEKKILEYDYTIPSAVCSVSRDLIEGILCPVENRLTLSQIRNHEFWDLFPNISPLAS